MANLITRVKTTGELLRDLCLRLLGDSGDTNASTDYLLGQGPLPVVNGVQPQLRVA